jgi:hypothetical protein
MFYQRLYRYSSLAVDCLPHFRFIKAYKLKPLFESTFISFNRGQTRSIPNVFLLYPYSFFASYPGSAIMYNTYGKENTKEEDVKGMYILLSGTLAVVTSAVRGTTILSIAAVHVRCSLYPNSHPLV